MSIVVTETERQMTWSRLEGLRFHWAVSSAPPPNQKWELPPRGWMTVPDTTVDAGGAWQSTFEKHPLPQPGGATAPDVMYTLLLSVSEGRGIGVQGVGYGMCGVQRRRPRST
jgi:hypothetical protein